MCKHKLGTSNRVDLVIHGQSVASLFDRKGEDPKATQCLFLLDLQARRLSAFSGAPGEGFNLPSVMSTLFLCM